MISDGMNSALIDFDQARCLLNVPDSTLERWVRQGKIPCCRIEGEVYFSRNDLHDWSREHDIPLVSSSSTVEDKRRNDDDLTAALTRGGVHQLHAVSLPELCERIVTLSAVVPLEMQTVLIDALLERENMATTAVGRGVAFPHPRQPERFHFTAPVVGLFHLDSPLSFQVDDDEPVFTVFALFTPQTRTHLRLMARLSQLLRQPGSLALLRSKPALAEVLAWSAGGRR